MHRRAFLGATASLAGSGGCLASERTGPTGSSASAAQTGSPLASGDDGRVGRHTVVMDGSIDHAYGGRYWFDPIGLHVPPETTVTWLSRRGAPHTATAYPERVPDGAEPFESPTLGQQNTFEHRFTVAGTYDYVCRPHERLGMVGRVVCGAPGDVPDGPTPGGPVPSARRIVEAGRVGIAEFRDAHG